jgi:hypothetical protein
MPLSRSWLAILFPCCIQTLLQTVYELHWATLRGMIRCLSSYFAKCSSSSGCMICGKNFRVGWEPYLFQSHEKQKEEFLLSYLMGHFTVELEGLRVQGTKEV